MTNTYIETSKTDATKLHWLALDYSVEFFNKHDRGRTLSGNKREIGRNSFLSKTSNVRTEILPTYFKTNRQKLISQFNAEKTKYPIYISGFEDVTSILFSELCDNISQLEFSACNVELTNTQHIKFTLSFPEKKILMISKSITSEEFNSRREGILFSFFINRKLIASDVAKLQPFIKGFKEYTSL